MAIASITAWLNSPSPNFLHGRLLYEQYGSDRLALTIIKSGSGSFHFEKLRIALEELNAHNDLVPKQIVFKEPVREQAISSAKEKGKHDLINAPEAIRTVRDEKNRIYAQARHWFTAIRGIDGDEHRLEFALKILNAMDSVKESWEVIDNYISSGQITELKREETIAEVSSLNTSELLKASKNIPTYITKARKDITNATDPNKKAKHQVKLQDLLTRLDEVKRRLNEIV